MHRIFSALVILLCATSAVLGQRPAPNLLRYVNPFIGTGGHGHTYPGATAPFGLVQLSPDTRIDMMDWDGCSGYHYSDSLIYGFSHTHLSGTGVADYCDILFKPFTGEARLDPQEYRAPFKKINEKAEAGYYSVFLDRDDILAELTATEHVGVHRYTFPKSSEFSSLLIDLRHRDEVLDAHIEIVGSNEVMGYRVSKAWAKEQHVYFVAKFSKPFYHNIILDMTKDPIEAQPRLTGKSIVALLDFMNDGPLVVTVGISGVSMESARRNLEAQCNHFDFDRTRAQTQNKWQKQLAKIEVESDDDNRKTIFYSALYHTMIAPNIWSDVNGQYRGRDNQIHLTKGFNMYTVFSLWDTYRACNPLYALLEPKRTNDFIETFLTQSEQSGLLPVWELSANETDCMIGNHAIPVITDAWMKGIRGFDPAVALDAMEKNVLQMRLGQEAYRLYGFVPSEQEPESVSKTLEYAYDDWCIAQLGKAVNANHFYTTYIRKAQFYKNLFDPSTRFFRARNNGGWHTPFDPFEVNFNYTEANAWQYRFAVPQDISGLMNMMGGREAFIRELDGLFTAKAETTGRNQADITGLIGQYVHGNEPSHHMAYLYNYAGEPWKSQQRTRQILDEMYHNRPDGLSGNEDCGQMSAWYVLSALGIYQVTPGDPTYTFGSPIFDKVTIHLDNGNHFVIDARGASAQKCYIRNAVLNGTDWPNTWISHETVLKGGTLTFEMADQPSRWGAAENERPVSKLDATPLTPVPFISKGTRTFRNGQSVELGCSDPSAEIRYAFIPKSALKGKPKWKKYEGPITVDKSCYLTFYSEIKDNQSAEVLAEFNQIPEGLRVNKYNTRYNSQYTARGDEGLIDGVRGSKTDFRTGDWQGFEGVNLDVVLDLGTSKKIKRVEAGFFQDENAWIFFPKEMQVEVSEDGLQWKKAGKVTCPFSPSEKGALQHNFVVKTNGEKGRYVRVIGVSLGKCPDNHKGKGFPCWVFADEISVE
ncbi:MAG: GH92 family glycosyl hydrolase [Saprospiraceae bacterium]|nr:GH92 family glycosyl hydrolase [Saprospiraceae bacterium]